MEAIYQKTPNGLVPASVEAQELFDKIKDGELVTVEVKKKRNLKFQRKYFSMLNFAVANQGKIPDETAFRDYCQAKAGHGIMLKIDDHTKTLCRYLCKENNGSYIEDANGNYWYVQGDSIAFQNMKEDEFEKLYSDVWAVIQADFIPMDREDLERELNGY